MSVSTAGEFFIVTNRPGGLFSPQTASSPGISIRPLRNPIPVSAPGTRSQKRSDVVELSDLYIFATSGEPGFTLSHGLNGETPGVVGADLARDRLGALSARSACHRDEHGLHLQQKQRGIALPDAGRIANAVQSDGEMLVVPAKIGYLNNLIVAGLVRRTRTDACRVHV